MTPGMSDDPTPAAQDEPAPDDIPRECQAIIGESVKPGHDFLSPDRCGKPGTLWRGPNSLAPVCLCSDHEPTNPVFFRVDEPS